jgi:hypothetical protein
VGVRRLQAASPEVAGARTSAPRAADCFEPEGFTGRPHGQAVRGRCGLNFSRPYPIIEPMLERTAVFFALALVGAIAATGSTASASHATIPAQWKNCTAVHRHYSHGVGRDNAHDHTTGTAVTNFKHSTKLYNNAMSFNRGLDGDKDGVACEQ